MNFEIHHLQLMKVSHLVVRTLSVQTCAFISSVFAAGDRDSYKHTKSRKEKRGNDKVENFVYISKKLS